MFNTGIPYFLNYKVKMTPDPRGFVFTHFVTISFTKPDPQPAIEKYRSGSKPVNLIQNSIVNTPVFNVATKTIDRTRDTFN